MLKNLGGLLVGLIIGAALMVLMGHGSFVAPHFGTPYQAILLDTGRVYYGKIQGLGSDYPVLREVYYVQSTTDPQTKQVTNVLIRRGKEWHGPEFTVLNARHIAMIEPVGSGSKVAQLIADQEKKK